MAENDSSSVPKPLVYDPINRLNASFARVHSNIVALGAEVQPLFPINPFRGTSLDDQRDGHTYRLYA
jgi:hypothetical protein